MSVASIFDGPAILSPGITLKQLQVGSKVLDNQNRYFQADRPNSSWVNADSALESRVSISLRVNCSRQALE